MSFSYAGFVGFVFFVLFWWLCLFLWFFFLVCGCVSVAVGIGLITSLMKSLSSALTALVVCSPIGFLSALRPALMFALD
jgi:hypothetical protein